MSSIPSSESTSGQGAFLFIGQAGCQIGSALWMLYNAEHAVQPDGVGLSGDGNKGEHIGFYKGSIFFQEDEFHRGFCYNEVERSGKFVPRTLFVDLEPMVIDEIRTGAYRNLFAEDWSFHEYSKVGDGAGIFSRAYNSIGRSIISNVMDTVRHISEKSSRLNVFNIARSYGGATGSGLGSLILEKIHDNYPKILIAESNVLNSDCATSPTVEPYNTIFGIESSCTSGGITFLYNNTALKDICHKNLRIGQPHFYHLNQVMSHGISGIYSSERFPGYGCCNLSTILTNLIPYPRIQLAVCSMAPIISKKVMRYEPSPRSTDMVSSLLSNDHTMFDINMNTGSFISCCVIYRGMVSPSSIAASNQAFLNEKKVKMVEWSPRGIKSGHSPLSITSIPSFDIGVSQLSMTMLSNHTNISDALAKECFAAHVMLKKKAFIHWYTDHGMEEEDFNSALENAMLLTLDYKEIDTSPEGAMKLFTRQNTTEYDESGKKIKKQNDNKIEKEEGDIVYASPSIVLNQGDEIQKTGITDHSKAFDDSTLKSEGALLLETLIKKGGGTDEENAEVLNAICGEFTVKDRQQLLALAKEKGVNASFLNNLDDPEMVVTLDMLQTLNNLIEEAQPESITVTMTNKSLKSTEKLQNALLQGKGNNELNGEVAREVWDNLKVKDRRNILEAASLNGIDTVFLDQMEDPYFEVTYEMLQTINTLIELAPPDTLTQKTLDQNHKGAKKLKETILLEDGNEEKYREVLKEICDNMTEADRKALYEMAQSQGIDASFLYGIEDDKFEVSHDMLEALNELLEQKAPNSITYSETNQSTRSMALLKDALLDDKGNNEKNKKVLEDVLGNMREKDRKHLLAVAEQNGTDVEFLKQMDDPNAEVTLEMLQTLNKLLEQTDPKSNTNSATNQSTKSMALLQDALLADDDNNEKNKEVLKEVLGNMTEKDREHLLAVAEQNGTDVEFLKQMDDPNVEVTHEMLQTLNNLLEQTGPKSNTNSVPKQSTKSMALLQDALLADDDNNEKNKEVLKEVLGNMTEKDREHLLAVAEKNGTDVEFLKQMDDPNLEVSHEMLQTLNNLLEQTGPKSNTNSVPKQSTKSMALLQDALLADGGNNEKNKEVLKEILGNMTKTDREQLLDVAEQNGTDVEFLKQINNPDSEVTHEMLQTLNKLLEQTSPKSNTNSVTIQSTRSMALLQDALIAGEGNNDRNREVLNDLCENMTENDRKLLLDIAQQRGINAEFLKQMDDPKFEITNEMLENMNKLMDPGTDKSTLTQANEPTKSIEMLQEAIKEGVEDNKVLNSEIMRDICGNMTNKDRKELRELAKEKGIDGSFLENLDDPNLVVTKDMLQSLNTLLAETSIIPTDETLISAKPDKGPKEKVKHAKATTSIEPTKVEKHDVKIDQPAIYYAFTLRKTYEESYVQCISPKTTMTNIDYYNKLNSRANSA